MLYEEKLQRTQYVASATVHSFPMIDRQLYLLHTRRGNNRRGIPKFKLCWASCMFYRCILHCTLLPPFFLWETSIVGFPTTVLYVELTLFGRHRNNRMDLSNERPVPMTCVTTMEAASLDNMGSSTQQYVLSLVPFPGDSEEGC